MSGDSALKVRVDFEDRAWVGKEDAKRTLNIVQNVNAGRGVGIATTFRKKA